MIRANVPKSPTQHLTYRPPPPGRCQGAAERRRDGKTERSGVVGFEKKWGKGQGRNGFSSLYYKGPISLFLFRPPRRQTGQALPALLSLSPFITHTFKAFSSCRLAVRVAITCFRKREKKNLVFKRNWGEVQPWSLCSRKNKADFPNKNTMHCKSFNLFIHSFIFEKSVHQ